MAKTHTKSIVPLRDRVLVRRIDDAGEKTVSGIIIPETVGKERPQIGTVVAVGDGRVTDSGEVIALTVKAGDTVLFAKYGPDEVKYNGEEYLIVSESSILAVIK